MYDIRKQYAQYGRGNCGYKKYHAVLSCFFFHFNKTSLFVP